MVVGEAWGDSERAAGKPFVGASGQELERMLREAGIDPARCFFTNLVNEKPNANDMSFMLLPNEKKATSMFGDGVRPNARLAAGLQRLDAQITTIQPKIIIATGNWPLWYLTGNGDARTQKGFKMPTGIDKWRGSQLFLKPSPYRSLRDIPVLPIYHPAAILRQYINRKITVQDLSRVKDFLDGMSWRDIGELDRSNVIHPKPDEVGGFVDAWIKDPDTPIVNDLETKQQRIHIVGLTRDGKTNITIPFFRMTPDGFRPMYSPLDFRTIYRHLLRLFSAPGMKFVGQNWIYDIQYITKFFFVTPTCYWDTMIAQHVAFPALRKSLDILASMYCKHYVYWKEDLKESSENFNIEQACLYNCEDLWRTHEVWKSQEIVLPALDKIRQFRRRMQAFPALVEMMNDGVLMDQHLRNKQRLEMMELSSKISAWLEEVMPNRVKDLTKNAAAWYDSPKQLGYILYDVLRLKPVINRATGARTTGKEALAELGDRYPQWAGLFSAILIQRSISVLGGNILSAKTESDNRMRTAYDMARAETFRLTSSINVWDTGANLQNIMRDREDMDLDDQDLI